MLNFLYSLFMGIVVVIILIAYVVYLVEWMRLPFKNKWIKAGVYLLITLVPLLGLVIYKYSKKNFLARRGE